MDKSSGIPPYGIAALIEGFNGINYDWCVIGDPGSANYEPWG